ncbi:hypothetical protein NA56DRAFT_713186 [Hyaloscypha hepaticicola]|uniref:Uncharacterized protein n=1 Tax=Hyaloscypha hepaticicola TaxID=2082293 RepID=A0A2J6PEF3_9HELO|nr:hypothetical protein NA56DRAFT_713186 [Hyaloscypha hepaticicola]
MEEGEEFQGRREHFYSAGHLTNDRNYNYPARKPCGNIKDAIHKPAITRSWRCDSRTNRKLGLIDSWTPDEYTSSKLNVQEHTDIVPARPEHWPGQKIGCPLDHIRSFSKPFEPVWEDSKTWLNPSLRVESISMLKASPLKWACQIRMRCPGPSIKPAWSKFTRRPQMTKRFLVHPLPISKRTIH